MSADADILQLISQVKVEGNFDQTDEVVLNWLSRRHQLMCQRSRCYRTLATVDDIPPGSIFPLALLVEPLANDGPGAEVAEILELAINGLPWREVEYSMYLKAVAGTVRTSGSGGLWTKLEVADEDSGSSNPALAVYPEPTEAFSFTIRVARVPGSLNLDTHLNTITQIKVPASSLDGLVAGAIATGLARTEQRPDLASTMKQEFDDACEELRRHVNRKYRGSQPATIRVEGYDA